MEPPTASNYSRQEWSALTIQERIRAMNDTLDIVEQHQQPDNNQINHHHHRLSIDPIRSQAEDELPFVQKTSSSTSSNSAAPHVEQETIPKRSSVVDIWRKREEGSDIVSPRSAAGHFRDRSSLNDVRKQLANQWSAAAPSPSQQSTTTTATVESAVDHHHHHRRRPISQAKHVDHSGLLVLVSHQSLSRELTARQQKVATVLTARGIPYLELDGADPINRRRRNELFEISGLRGKYPQFFLVLDGRRTLFWGGWDRFEHANDEGTLADQLLQPAAAAATEQSSEEEKKDDEDEIAEQNQQVLQPRAVRDMWSQRVAATGAVPAVQQKSFVPRASRSPRLSNEPADLTILPAPAQVESSVEKKEQEEPPRRSKVADIWAKRGLQQVQTPSPLMMMTEKDEPEQQQQQQQQAAVSEAAAAPPKRSVVDIWQKRASPATQQQQQGERSERPPAQQAVPREPSTTPTAAFSPRTAKVVNRWPQPMQQQESNEPKDFSIVPAQDSPGRGSKVAGRWAQRMSEHLANQAPLPVVEKDTGLVEESNRNNVFDRWNSRMMKGQVAGGSSVGNETDEEIDSLAKEQAPEQPRRMNEQLVNQTPDRNNNNDVFGRWDSRMKGQASTAAGGSSLGNERQEQEDEIEPQQATIQQAPESPGRVKITDRLALFENRSGGNRPPEREQETTNNVARSSSGTRSIETQPAQQPSVAARSKVSDRWERRDSNLSVHTEPSVVGSEQQQHASPIDDQSAGSKAAAKTVSRNVFNRPSDTKSRQKTGGPAIADSSLEAKLAERVPAKVSPFVKQDEPGMSDEDSNTVGKDSDVGSDFSTPSKIIQAWNQRGSHMTAPQTVKPAKLPKPATLHKVHGSMTETGCTAKDGPKPVGGGVVLSSRSSAFNAWNNKEEKQSEVNSDIPSSPARAVSARKTKKDLVEIGRKHVEQGLAHKGLTTSINVPDDGSVRTAETVATESTAPRLGATSLASLVRKDAREQGSLPPKDKIQLPVGWDATKIDPLSMSKSVASVGYESDDTPKMKTTTTTNRNYLPSPRAKSQRQPLPLETAKEPKPTKPQLSINTVVTEAPSDDSMTPRSANLASERLVGKKKRLQAQRRRLKQLRSPDSDEGDQPSAREIAERIDEMLPIDENSAARALERPSNHASEYTSLRASTSAFFPASGAAGQHAPKTSAKSPLSESGQSEGAFSFFSEGHSAPSEITRNSSGLSASSSLASRAERILKERRRRYREGLLNQGRAQNLPQNDFSPSQQANAQAEMKEYLRNNPAAMHPRDDWEMSANDTRNASSRLQNDRAGLSSRYNTSSRFIEHDISTSLSAPVTSDGASLEQSLSTESAESSFRSFETATTESDSRYSARKHTSNRAKDRELHIRSTSASSDAMVSDQFGTQNSNSMEACKSECESLSFKQIAADWVGEVKQATTSFDLSKLASDVNENLKSISDYVGGSASNSTQTTPKQGLRIPKCNDLVPFDEDVAIEVEYMEDSLDESLDEDDNGTDAEVDDPKNDLGVCGPVIDDAVFDTEVQKSGETRPSEDVDLCEAPCGTQAPAGQPSFEEPHASHQSGKKSAYV